MIMKRFVSLLLAIVLCLGVLPSSVFAAGETEIGLGTLEAENCQYYGQITGVYTDSAASGGKGVDNLYFVGDGITLGKLTTSVNKLTIYYASQSSGTFGVYVNDVKVQDVTIVSNNAWNGSYTTAVVNFSPALQAGDVLALKVNVQGQCWNIDKFILEKTDLDPYTEIKFSDIYGTDNFQVVANASNGNQPQIDESADSLGWLGDGAVIGIQNLYFGSGAVSNVSLQVEMNRGYEVVTSNHFEVYALPAGTSVTSTEQLTEANKIGLQAALPAAQQPDGHTTYFVQTISVPDNLLSGTMDIYFKILSGSFNLKSVRFAVETKNIAVNKDNALIYTKAASNFNEALPIGNGFVGAMVYGGVSTERIGLNETTIWTGSPYENNVEGASANLDSWRAQTLSGSVSDNYYYWTNQFVDNTKKDATAYGPSFSGSQKYQLAGELQLTTEHLASAYTRYLDLDTAVAVTEYDWNDSRITREYFVSNPDRVMAMRLTSDNNPMTFTGSYDLKGMVNNGILVEGDDTLVIKGGVNDYRGVTSGIEYTVRVKFVPVNGTLSHTQNSITVTDTTDCTILLVIATNFVSYNDISADEDALAANMMESASAKTYAELKNAHVADYQTLYNRVELDLGGSDTTNVPIETVRQNLADKDDPAFVELAYNYDRYLQIAASRKGAQATNLQGIWNDDLTPMWDCNYTTNINLQMNYWATLSTNLEECYAPVVEKLKSLQAQGHITAKELYGITTEGAWTLHHNTDLWSVTGPVAGDWGMTPTAGVWLSNEAYTVYQYNQNTTYLEDIYPVLKGAAQFMLEFLVEDSNGQLQFCPSSSPEIANLATGQFVSVNSAFDIQVTNELFRNVIEAAGILNRDSELVSQLETALNKLPPVVGVGSWGQVQEFYGYDGDSQTNNHRHISHLYGVYPGTSITNENAEFWNAAKTTLDKRSVMVSNETLTGWSIAWRIAQYACFGDGAKAHEFIKAMYDMSYNYCRPNLFTVCEQTFQYDANGGMLAAVTTMLVEEQNGTVLLKGLPSQWQNGSIKGIRLKGNFTLDEMVWENGMLKSATVTSHSGKPLNLTYGDKTVTMETVVNETYVFDGSLSLPNDESVTEDTNGDVDGDGEIDVYDAALVYAIANGKTDATEAQLVAADVNGDGEVTPMDAALIYAYANKKIEQFVAPVKE